MSLQPGINPLENEMKKTTGPGLVDARQWIA